jgi:hypothetical protein
MTIFKQYSIVLTLTNTSPIFNFTSPALVGLFVVNCDTNEIISFVDDHGFQYPLNFNYSNYIVGSDFGIYMASITSPQLNTNYYLNPSQSQTYFNIFLYNGQQFVDTDYNVIQQNNLYTITFIQNVPCFLENTKILCLKDNTEQYIPIQDLKINDLVKTYKHDYIPIELIKSFKIYNYHNNNIKDQLYVLKKDKYDLLDDLVITGTHCILVDELPDIDIIRMTDDKYRLPIYVDLCAEKYNEGLCTLWHLVLKSNNKNINYGIYANGLLVESCIKKAFLNFFKIA